MPGLLRGVARTAVIAGTASAVNGRVQRRQAERFADRDAQIYANREQAYEQSMASQQAPPAQYEQAPPPPDRSETLDQLRQLGELKAQGILTEEEFAAEKARILGG
jgi:Short C-terminal domain